jgi:hypothetical protein
MATGAFAGAPAMSMVNGMHQPKPAKLQRIICICEQQNFRTSPENVPTEGISNPDEDGQPN